MKITKAWLHIRHKEFNKKYFNGKLTLPLFEITNVKGYLGLFTRANGRISTICISNKFDRTERDFCQTLLHEMIHQYIRENNLKDTRPHHGAIFYREADRINRLGGWNISRTDSVEGIGLTNNQNKEYNVLVFQCADRKRCFQMVMNKSYVSEYIEKIRENRRYFIVPFIFKSTDDSRFAYLPECRGSVRGKFITKEDYNRMAEEEDIEMIM